MLSSDHEEIGLLSGIDNETLMHFMLPSKLTQPQHSTGMFVGLPRLPEDQMSVLKLITHGLRPKLFCPIQLIWLSELDCILPPTL